MEENEDDEENEEEETFCERDTSKQGKNVNLGSDQVDIMPTG